MVDDGRAHGARIYYEKFICEYQFTRTIAILITVTQAQPSISGSGMKYALAPSALALTKLSSHMNIGLAAGLLF